MYRSSAILLSSILTLFGFSTTDKILAADVILLSPVNGASFSAMPTFHWSEHADASSYTILIADAPDMDNVLISENVGSKTVTPDNPGWTARWKDLSPGKKYYWAVRYRNKNDGFWYDPSIGRLIYRAGGSPVLSVEPLAVDLPAGGSATVTVKNSGTGRITWNVAPTKITPWLKLSLTEGELGPGESQTISVSEKTAPPAGNPLGTFTVSSGVGNKEVTVNYQPPAFSLSPAVLNLLSGQAATITITNGSGINQKWSIVEQPDWLVISPISEGYLQDGAQQTLTLVEKDVRTTPRDASGEIKLRSELGQEVSIRVGYVFAPSNPALTLSSAQIEAGDNVIISGTGFTPGAAATLFITNVGLYHSEEEVTVDAEGRFNFSFNSLATSPSGVYYVRGTDNTSGKSSSRHQFELREDEASAGRIDLLAPENGKTYYQGDVIFVEWKDAIRRRSEDRLNGAGTKRYFEYEIQYSRNDGASWVSLATHSGYAALGRTAAFRKSFIVKADHIGNLSFRVQDITPVADDGTRKSDADDRIAAGLIVRPHPYSNIVSLLIAARASSDAAISLEWDNIYDYQADEPQGVAADGLARIFIRVEGGSKPVASVSLQLRDRYESRDPEALGKVMARRDYRGLYSSEADGTRAVSASQSIAHQEAYYFWYVAPDDFSVDSDLDDARLREVEALATVKYQDGTQSEAAKQVQICRPPLMLVHGLGGSSSSWDNFRYERPFLRNQAFASDPRFVSLQVPSLSPRASFRANAEILLYHRNGGAWNARSFLNALGVAHRAGFAACRLDYVAHSMGGSILRQAAAMPGYNTLFNRNKGYVNRAVTLNTPHNGSPFADLLIDFLAHMNRELSLNDHSFRRVHSAIRTVAIRTDWLRDYIQMAGRGRNARFFAPAAIYDLSVGQGVRFAATPVPTHLIGTDLFSGNGPLHDGAIEETIPLWSKQLVVWRLARAFADVNYRGLRSELFWLLNDGDRSIRARSMNAMALILEPVLRANNISPDFFWESDLIVGRGSQLAGLPHSEWIVRPNYSFFDAIGHTLFMPVTEDIAVGNLVNKLLNSRSSQNFFAPIPASNARHLRQEKHRPGDRIAAGEPVVIDDSTQLTAKILTPVADLRIGGIMEVEVDLADTSLAAFLQEVKVATPDDVIILNNSTTSWRVNIPISGSFIDNQILEILATFSSSDTLLYSLRTLDFSATSEEAPTTIVNELPSVNLVKGETYQPTIRVYYETFSSELNDNNNFISITIDNPSIISFDEDQSHFTALAEGETFAIASYKNLSDTIYFNVAAAPQPVLAVQALEELSYCAGDDMVIDYDVSRVFEEGNEFVAELSDPQGEFSAVLELGRLRSLAAGSIAVSLPPDLEAGTQYRIRLRGTNPPVSSLTNDDSFQIHALPAVSLAPIEDICVDAEPLSLSGGTPAGGSYEGPGVMDALFNAAVAGPGAHTIIYRYSSAEGCVATVSRTLNVIPLPALPLITQDGDRLGTTAHAAYQWFLDGSVIPGATEREYQPTSSGLYQVEVYNDQGCSSRSTPFDFKLTTDISETRPPATDVVIFPNPVADAAALRFRTEAEQPVTIVIRNALGVEVARPCSRRIYSAGEHRCVIATGALSEGWYLCTLQVGERSMATTFVVTR